MTQWHKTSTCNKKPHGKSKWLHTTVNSRTTCNKHATINSKKIQNEHATMNCTTTLIQVHTRMNSMTTWNKHPAINYMAIQNEHTTTSTANCKLNNQLQGKMKWAHRQHETRAHNINCMTRMSRYQPASSNFHLVNNFLWSHNGKTTLKFGRTSERYLQNIATNTIQQST